MTDLADLTVTEALSRIRAGTLLPATLMEAYLDRIASREDTLRAMAYFDPASALAAAQKPGAGLLQGIPLGIMNAENARAMGWELTRRRELLSDELRERLDWGLAQPLTLLDEANEVFAAASRAFSDVMSGFDCLLTPSAPGEAPHGSSWTCDPVFNVLWTGLRVPCVTVPSGTGSGEMPLGLQVVAKFWDDAGALRWAEWVARN